VPHLTKISATAQYHYGLNKPNHDDPVLIVDGEDDWIQIRPETVVNRFFDINSRANNKLDNSFSNESTKQFIISQEIILGAQKRCWLWSADDPLCLVVPP
jgi:hypothetical protein